MSYKVRKNKLNDFTYITFGNIKVQVYSCNGTLCIYRDKSNFDDFINIQLIKTIKVDISHTDYDAMYKIAKDWLNK